MKFSANNFLKTAREIVTGGDAYPVNGDRAADGGYWNDNWDYLNNIILSTGATLTTDANNVPIVSIAAATTAVGALSFVIPRDYDETTDALRATFIMNAAGATDTPFVGLIPSITRASTGSTTAGTIVFLNRATTTQTGLDTFATVSTSTVNTTAQLFEATLAGNGLHRNDILSFEISTGAHGTNAVQIYGIGFTYQTDLVSYSTGNDQFGRNLRA